MGRGRLREVGGSRIRQICRIINVAQFSSAKESLATCLPGKGREIVIRIFIACCLLGTLAGNYSAAQEPLVPGQAVEAAQRTAYIIEVPLPLVGTRDEAVQQQINQVAAKSRGGERPVVVLHFKSITPANSDNAEAGRSGSRGTTFERGLFLARYFTSAAAAKVRLVAYLSEPVEGHAVLPVLACEDIYASPSGELGQASVDEKKVDEVIRGSYREIVKARQPLMEAAVAAMLDPNVEVFEVEQTDGSKVVVTGQEAKRLRDEGNVIRQSKPIWSGGGLASFGSEKLRSQGWIAGVVDSTEQLATKLNIGGRLKSVRIHPDKWSAMRLEVNGEVNAQRVNHFIRAINERKKKADFNLLLVDLFNADADLSEAMRLGLFLSEQQQEGITTVAILNESASTPLLSTALWCDQVISLKDASIGSKDRKPGYVRTLTDGTLKSLLQLEEKSGRSASLLLGALDPEAVVKLYVQQGTGKQMPMGEWQWKRQERPNDWVPQDTLVSDGTVPSEIALRYGLVDNVVDDRAAALRELGLESEPKTVEGPWIETTVQRMLAFEWLPRLLVTIGFMALMFELSSPGIGFGGFVAAMSFLGFFWIEGLNGNVEWLEVMLFVAGMTALGIEIFVLPGFGLFGIGGLLMVIASLVLASQTFIFPSNSEQLTVIANNLFWVAISALAVVIGGVAMGRRIENTPLIRWVAIEPAGADDIAELEVREALVHWEHLLGQDGLTTTRLNPGGKAQFGRMIVNVLGTQMIDEGVAVRVVEVRGNSVFVEPLE